MMAFQRDRFSDFYRLLRAEQGGSDAGQRAMSANFLLEERLTAEREDSYEGHLDALAEFGEWNFCHDNYLAAKINIKAKKLGLPETFTDINRPIFLSGLPEDRYLLRLEKLDWPCSLARQDKLATFDALNAYLAGKKDAEALVLNFFHEWGNSDKNDFRPRFAGFWDEVKELFVDSNSKERDNDNWANELRDRFGLGHYDPGSSEPIHVLLLRYRVGEVIAAVGADNAFAVPTVLDSDLNPFFCPSPSKEQFGLLVDLGLNSAAKWCPNKEILHQRIDWKPEHLYRVGLINTSPGANFAKSRQIHLDCLQNDFKHFKELCSAA